MAETNVPAEIAVLSSKVDMMHSDFRDMKSVLQELTAAINQLALVEERQAQFAAAQDRAFGTLKAHDDRIRTLELRAPENDRVAKWIDRGAWAIIAAVGMYVAKKTGLI